MTNPRPALSRAVSCALILFAGCASSPASASEPFVRAGSGPSVVVLQAGLGDGKEVWRSVMPELARDYTVVALDRAGTGANPARPGPRSPCDIAAEQRAQLLAMGLRPPYVLAGHSIGGLYQYAYAKLYPDEVAGLVLVDATHPRNLELIERELPHALSLVKAAKSVLWRGATSREFDDQVACLDKLDMDRPLSIPVQVLVAGRAQAISSPAFERGRLELGKDWTRMAGNVPMTLVPDSSHYIQKERPDVVVAAVRAVAGVPQATDVAAQPAHPAQSGSQ